MTQSDISEQALKDLQAAAEKGDAESQYKLGLAYESGDGLKQDDRSAALWFKRAAQQKYAPAFTKYGDCLYYACGVGQDHSKAFEQYLQGANAGQAHCMSMIGHAYRDGDGAEEDHKLALYWFEKAAQLGNAIGQRGLAELYASGVAVSKDLSKATELYLKSAQQGLAIAMFDLARLYAAEMDDPLEAEHWYRKAAQSNLTEAQYQLGRMFCYGEGVQRDTNESVYWLRRAVLNGYEGDARSLLAWDLHDESQGNYDECYYWAGHAAALDTGGLGKTFAAQLFDECNNSAMTIFWSNEAHKVEDTDDSRQALEKYCQRYNLTVSAAIDKLIECGVNPSDLTCGRSMVPFGSEIYCVLIAELAKPATLIKAEEEFFGAWDPVEELSDATANAAELTVAARPYAVEVVSADQQTSGQQTTAIAQSLGPQWQALNLPASQLPPGTILADKYLILSVLGKGGMAIVFKARHLLMERIVAIKMLLPESSKDPTVVNRFQREAQAASALRHPNVITIYDFGLSPDGQAFIVMDYLEGQSLEDLLEQHGPVPPARALPMLLQVCDALVAAHNAGILHRDIKPSNIMLEDTLTQKDYIRLVDFGIAKTIGEQDEKQQKLTKTGEVFGSLVYMSPEQCMGKPLDARADMYSFGCVIFELLTGELPFMGETVFDTMSKHIYEEPPNLAPLIAEYPGAAIIDAVYKKTVEKDPADRYACMSDVKRELLKAL